ncbi:MAG: GTPase HflX [Candidatus Shikimatogenerans sp. JK-2022]|nr:GTPase HflX [Candidatus Shikimatogenerans bostrichidophilus]
MYKKNILIGIFKNNKNKALEYLNELKNLLKVFNGKVIKKFLQKKNKKNNLTYVGKGFLEKINKYIIKKRIDTVIFDDELSLKQIKNIENKLKCFITDRTKLVLDIFTYRANSSYSKIQIKLAQYEYLLPRLKHMWMHLKRQKGGIGERGPGEKEIETDKRLIKKKIVIFKKKLQKINKQILIQRNNRKNKILISLVGYTNVGKTTILNKISNKNLLTGNQLFTTLDSNVNNFFFKKKKFLIVDTIGLLRKIPTKLIEYFKSSILEIKESNLIINIVDIHSKSILYNLFYVLNFLFDELNLFKKKILIVFNKIDKIKNFNLLFLKKKLGKILKKKYLIYKNKKIRYICITTKKKRDIILLKKTIYNELFNF